MRTLQILLTRLLPILAARKGGAAGLLPALLMGGLRRNPLGLIGMLLLRRTLAGNGRVFGMDIASRRQARMAWLTGLLERHGPFSRPDPKRPSAAKSLANLIRPPR
jgi:hypothetical protein